jgi:hypothetical protein
LLTISDLFASAFYALLFNPAPNLARSSGGVLHGLNPKAHRFIRWVCLALPFMAGLSQKNLKKIPKFLLTIKQNSL